MLEHYNRVEGSFGGHHVVKHVSVMQRPASRGQQTPCSSSLLFPLQRQVSGEAAHANSQFTFHSKNGQTAEMCLPGRLQSIQIQSEEL